MEKRKREDDGGGNAKRVKATEDDDGVVVPADEEVEEFFAILKRIQVAVKYFQERNGGGGRCTDRELTAAPWSLKFELEDFEGVKKEAESSEGNQSVGLDLNSDPPCDVSDRAG